MTDPQDAAREQFKLGIQKLNAALEAGYKQVKCGCDLTWSTIHRFDGPCEVLAPDLAGITVKIDAKLKPGEWRLERSGPIAKCDCAFHKEFPRNPSLCTEAVPCRPPSDPTAKAKEIAARWADIFCLPKENHIHPCPMEDYIAYELATTLEAEYQRGYTEGVALGPGFPNQAYEEGKKTGREEALKPYKNYTLPNGEEVNVLEDVVPLCNQSFDVGYQRGLEEAAEIAEKWTPLGQYTDTTQKMIAERIRCRQNPPAGEAMSLGDALANWTCVCGRHASIEHPFGGYCKAKEIIESLESQLRAADDLAKAVNDEKILYPFDLDTGEQLDSDQHEVLRKALAAYEKARG